VFLSCQASLLEMALAPSLLGMHFIYRLDCYCLKFGEVRGLCYMPLQSATVVSFIGGVLEENV
jgi:hypothetical protein